ncbi:MAG: response regulator [Patescibacteria group bacterium]|mgnify:CR=1 FL=1
MLKEAHNKEDIKKIDEKPKVLIVDDDEESANLLKGVFKSGGFEVKAAFDGLEGFDMATKFLPDVIITGIVMPRMSGFEMMKNLKGSVSTAKIPVMVFSHLGRQEDKEEAQKMGARDFIIRGMTTPADIVKKSLSYITKCKVYYLRFDIQDADARALGKDFNFPPMFECKEEERMFIKLEPDNKKDFTPTFKATFVCK